MKRANGIRVFVAAAACVLLATATAARAGELKISASSFVGVQGDAVVGAAIQSDGTIVLAANMGGGALPRAAFYKLSRRGKGYVLRLKSDGRTLISASLVAGQLRDMAIDGKDNIYLAAAGDGAMRLDPAAKRITARTRVRGLCARVDPTDAGDYWVALGYDKDEESTPGPGTITLLNARGGSVGAYRGHRHTLDVAIHGESQTIAHIGWRQANAFDGKKTYPVQIAYMRGLDYRGQVKYLNYDWSTQRDVPNFLNKPENNMADTRGYRCSIGRDGKLYAAFEAAGGNHIFRYEPRLEEGEWVKAGDKAAGGDRYHQFHNSKAEHKTFMGRYDPATGSYELGQQFCGRLSSGKANAVRVKSGAITADASGQVWLGGGSAAGLPLSIKPEDSGDYTGGGFLLGLSSSMDSRVVCTRLQPGSETHAVDARVVDGKTIVVMAGSANQKSADEFHAKEPLQKQGVPGCGFFAVLTGGADE